MPTMVGWPVSLTTKGNLTLAERTFSLQVMPAAVINMDLVDHSKHFKDTEVAEKMSMHTNQPTTTVIGATSAVMEEVVLGAVDTEEVAVMEAEAGMEEEVDTEEVDMEVVDLEQVDLDQAVMATDMEDTSGQCM